MSFFAFAADLISKLAISVAGRSLGETLKDIRTARRMGRMVEEAVDCYVQQVEEYLCAAKVSDHRKGILITELHAKLQSLVDDPQQFFAGNLDGALIFKQCHPDGELPQAIREEQLGQFYTVLFPQIAHFLAGSHVALAQWQAEGYREEFKRLSQIADEIRQMNAKVAGLPEAVTGAMTGMDGQEADALLRDFAQTLLNKLLLRLDLSPLRAERALSGSLGDHFVIPAFHERRKDAKTIGEEAGIISALVSAGARRIVHGMAGAGKSTWSQWLQSRLLQADPRRLCVVLRLRQIKDIDMKSLLDLLREYAGAHLRDALNDKVIRSWHLTGRLVVILDGFDEVPEERRDAVENWVKDLAIVAERTSILVTSRPLHSGHLERLPNPWQQWDLLPFEESRIFSFIERWHRYLPEGELSAADRQVDAKALAHSFCEDPSLKPLAETPLMLGTLLFVYHRDKKLPSGRVDLYERYVATMLGLRDSGLGIQARSTNLNDKQKRQVLAHIALHFHLNSVNEVNDDTMYRLANEALDKFRFEEAAERLLPALCERTGLLEGPGAWSFMHKTISEFLVAELICDGMTSLPDGRRLDRKELWTHRHEDTWTAVLFFWAGKASSRELEEFIGELLDERTDHAYLLALSLLHDQGERFMPETQRALALRIIKMVMPKKDSDIDLISDTGIVPVFASQEYAVSAFNLRGLSSYHNVDALIRLFTLGALLPADVNGCHETLVTPLTIAYLWSLSDDAYHATLDGCHHLRHIPPRDLALYCFNARVCHLLLNSSATLQHCHKALAEWLRAFPSGRPWTTLLLAGALFDNPLEDETRLANTRKKAGPLLWEWRNEAVADDWLRESDVCCGVFTQGTIDILRETRQALVDCSSEAWDLNAEKHDDLLVWCDLMIARRKNLKS